jgi:ketosteroid isomerase-like protein
MKVLLSLAMVGFVFTGAAAFGQSADGNDLIEREIRELDFREADAVLRGDFATVEQLWAADLVVNNPFNEVVQGSQGPIRTGALTYSSFVRAIESVQVHGDTVIVMGRETVVPRGNSPDAGETIHRRYTNIWMKRNGRWLLTARHANVICPT